MRRLSLLAAVLALAACPFSGQAIHRQSQVLQRGDNVSAEIVPFAQIQVCAAGTGGSTCGAVSIYSDYSLTLPITGPITADASGNYDYYTGTTCVDEVITSPGTEPRVLPYVCAAAGGSGTLTDFSAGNLAPLFTTTVTNATTAPTLAFNLSTAPTFTFYGNFNSTTAAPQFWTMAAGSNITLTPSGTTLTISANSAAGSGCGPLSIDATSTNCGNGNFVSFTGSESQAFGYQNMNTVAQGFHIAIGNNSVTNSTQPDVIGIGDHVATDVGASSDLVAIGDSSAQFVNVQNSLFLGDFAGSNTGGANVTTGTNLIGIGESALDDAVGSTAMNDIIAIGQAAFSRNTANDGAGLPFNNNNVIAIGQAPASNYTASVNNIVALGDAAGSISDPTSYIPSTFAPSDLVAIGDGAGTENGGSIVVAIGIASGNNYATGSTEIVGIGDGAATGAQTQVGFNAQLYVVHDVIGIGDAAANRNKGNDVVAIGDTALGGYNGFLGNAGDHNIAIGDHAEPSNTTGTHNTVVGGYAGGVGWTSGTSIGNSNQTGSQNTWIGDNSGPNTTTQLSNTIALGYNAQVSQSNQAVIGSSAITQTVTYGVQVAGTIYSAAGTALPACSASLKGATAVVSDATSPTYMGAYTSGGSVTAAVLCSYNGTTYSWLTH